MNVSAHRATAPRPTRDECLRRTAEALVAAMARHRARQTAQAAA